MGHRLSKIYTRTGDAGTTGLGDGSRVSKDDLRVEAFGTVDELNSALGVLLSQLDEEEELVGCLLDIQHDLFDLGGELCIPDTRVLKDEHVERLENILDDLNAELPPLKDFVLPGGSRAAASCHLSRTVARRAERRLISLANAVNDVSPISIKYLNRLSDLLFVAARHLNRKAGHAETLWDHQRRQ